MIAKICYEFYVLNCLLVMKNNVWNSCKLRLARAQYAAILHSLHNILFHVSRDSRELSILSSITAGTPKRLKNILALLLKNWLRSKRGALLRGLKSSSVGLETGARLKLSVWNSPNFYTSFSWSKLVFLFKSSANWCLVFLGVL